MAKKNTNPKSGFKCGLNPGFGFVKMNRFPRAPGFLKHRWESLIVVFRIKPQKAQASCGTKWVGHIVDSKSLNSVKVWQQQQSWGISYSKRKPTCGMFNKGCMSPQSITSVAIWCIDTQCTITPFSSCSAGCKQQEHPYCPLNWLMPCSMHLATASAEHTTTWTEAVQVSFNCESHWTPTVDNSSSETKESHCIMLLPHILY